MRIWPPAVLKGHRERQAELDARVGSAAQERCASLERLARVQEDVMGPVQEFGRRNQFADLIRNSLREGHRR